MRSTKIKRCGMCGKFLGEDDFGWVNKEKGYRNSYCEKCDKTRTQINFPPSGKPRGRKKGYKVSQKTKDKIAKTRTGHSHSKETKDKISAGMLKHFDELYPFSKELLREYRNSKEFGEVYDFVKKNEKALDADKNILTEKRLRSRRNKEVSFDKLGHLSSNNITPELLVMAKQEIEIQQKIRYGILFRDFGYKEKGE